MPRTPKKPAKHILEQMDAIKPLVGLIGLFNKDVREGFAKVQDHAATVKQMMADFESFGRSYSPLGWSLHDNISTDVVAAAVRASVEEGERQLTEHYLNPDTLQFLEYRFRSPTYEPWLNLYETAVSVGNEGLHFGCAPFADHRRWNLHKLNG